MSRIYSFLAALATVILFALVVWQMGYKAAQRDAKELEAKQLGQAFEQGREFGTVRDRVVTEYVDRVQIVEKRGATIIKEVPVYVSPKADAACAVNTGFVRLHDAAATGVDLPPTGNASAANDAPSGVALSAVAATNVANYTACNANAEQLSSLQILVREFQARQRGQPPPDER